MADTRQRTTWGSRFRFAVRALGLSGVAAVVVGFGLALAAFPPVDFSSWESVKAIPDVASAAAKGAHGELAQAAAWLLAGGLLAVVVALVVEALGGLLLGVGRRTAAGTTATVGVVAAVVLLILVNAYSFTHYGRFDATRDRRFTLPPDVADQMRSLRAGAPTTIVVLQMHNFGSLSPRRDSYTKAAEEKVTEKVKDLVDQFREFGPRFNVVVLDSEAFGYQEELKRLTQDTPELKTAIDAAPENSIFFHANKRVQRLSFNEFMQLDKTASKEVEGAENLVLLPQGIDTFARRVLSVQERRPKVAVCVVHELLTTGTDDPEKSDNPDERRTEESDNRYTLAGLRKALTAQGYDVMDIVLKKNWASAQKLSDLKPAADTREESKLERLEGELEDADAEASSARAEAANYEAIRAVVERVKGKPWDERKALYTRLTRRNWTEEQEPQLLASLAKSAERAQAEVSEAAKKKAEAEKRLTEAMKDERPLQDRRISDVSAKFTKQLADVDLLIVPRYTTEDAMKGPGVEAGLHALSKEQAKVAKEFMKRGKPVLACLGPITPQITPIPGAPADEFDKAFAKEIAAASDEFEALLADRGIEMGRSVILFDGETKALARSDQLSRGPIKPPPVVIADAKAGTNPNPVAAAFRLTGRTAESTLDLRLRALRPIGLSPAAQARQPFAAEIAFTSGESWSELQPYPRFGRGPDGARRLVYMPKYEPTGLDDAKKGTRDEEKKDAFPIAVAVESRVPAAWLYDDYESRQLTAALDPFSVTPALGLMQAADRGDRPTQRTVVFGSGHLFGGPELKPAQEKLLLHTANWLTGREDRLPKSELPAWQYPRVAMSDREQTLWRYGTAAGLPLVAAYAGLLATMRRRMR